MNSIRDAVGASLGIPLGDATAVVVRAQHVGSARLPDEALGINATADFDAFVILVEFPARVRTFVILPFSTIVLLDADVLDVADDPGQLD